MKLRASFIVWGLSVFLFFGCARTRPLVERELPGEKDAAYYYLRSEIEARGANIAEAISNLDRAIEKDKNQPYLWFKRASLYASIGDLKKAEEDVRQALAVSPDDLPSLILLGKIHQSQNRFEEATAAYQRALKVDAGSEEANFLLLEVYVAQKNYPAALELVQAWKRRESDSVIPLFYEASLYQNFIKNPSKAIAAYRQILNLEPDNVRALSALAELYLNRKEERNVLDTFRQMEALAPTDVALQLKMAVIYYEHKQYDRAVEKFQEILKIHPDADRIVYYLGVIYENIKRDDEARVQFEKIRDNSDFYKDARIHLAFLKRRADKEDEAIRILEEAIRAKPKVNTFYEYLAEIHRDRRDFAKAVGILKKGLARCPDKESLYYSLGMVYERAEQFDEGVRAMQSVLKINPENPNALNFIGYSYADRRIKLDEAMALIQKALLLKPDDGYITDSLGWAHYQKGDLDQALVYIQKAYQLAPKEPTITEHLGDVFLAQNERKKALKYFREALSLLEKKDDAQSQKDRERLKGKIETIQR